MTDDMLTDYEREQAIEWGTFVARTVITIDGVRAFNPGDSVPASHVARGIVLPAEVRLVDEVEPEPEPVAVAPPIGTLEMPTDEDYAAAVEANAAAGAGSDD
jgi:hypothetical protein